MNDLLFVKDRRLFFFVYNKYFRSNMFVFLTGVGLTEFLARKLVIPA